MNKNRYCFLVFISIWISFCFLACKKEQNTPTIILYNKPLKTIRSYIQGNWKLQYGKGGICGSCIQYYDSTFWKFTSNNRIAISYKGTTYTDTIMTWIKELGTYTNGDSTFVMNFYDKRGYPTNLIVEGIFNDTLILHDDSSDAMFYHFTKS